MRNAPKGDHGCNFKCSTTGRTTKANEEAVVVRPEKDTCSTPPPPPLPPTPPTPANLCPVNIPADWRAACMGGDLFYDDGTATDTGQYMPCSIPDECTHAWLARVGV